MRVEDFVRSLGSDFYTGVPDSLLRPLCDFIYKTYGTDPKHHIIAADEGNAVGIAAGYHLATGKVPVVYMQNSGEGNIINPLASLMNEEVYGIPCIFVIGWRGEPGVRDEPQHIYQGKVTGKLLDIMGVGYHVVDSETTEADMDESVQKFKVLLDKGSDVAFIIKKGALTYEEKVDYAGSPSVLTREQAIGVITKYAGDDPIISTTGKSSRELFEIREHRKEGHGHDFLTVGSMGHASSIALGIALQKPDKRIWCIDGDGATLMHMGAMAVIGSTKPKNLIHVLINNGSHESVGGMPVCAKSLDYGALADVYGYRHAYSVSDESLLTRALDDVTQKSGREAEEALIGPALIDVQCNLRSRADLGRPTMSPRENKERFIEALNVPNFSEER